MWAVKNIDFERVDDLSDHGPFDPLTTQAAKKVTSLSKSWE
jgi:hypothetical protein